MRVDILTLNFSIKNGLKINTKTKMKNCWTKIDGLKTVTKAKMKNCWTKIDQELHCA